MRAISGLRAFVAVLILLGWGSNTAAQVVELASREQVVWRSPVGLAQLSAAQNGRAEQSKDGLQLLLPSGAARGFIAVEESRYLSLAPQGDGLPAVWHSTGDGLFMQIEPLPAAVAGARIYDLGSAATGLLMISKEGGAEQALILRLSSIVKGGALQRSPRVLLADENRISLSRSDGFFREDFNRVQGGESLSLQLQGPARYRFEWRTPWIASYGSSEWMQLQVAVDGRDGQMVNRQLRPETGFSVEIDDCDSPVSQQNSFVFDVPAGEHSVSLTSDRPLFGRWKALDENQRFFYAHNDQPQLHDTPVLSVEAGQSDVQAAEYYRTLPPQQHTGLASWRPLRATAFADSSGLLSALDRNLFAERAQVTPGPLPSPLRFSEVAGGARLNYLLPQTTENPPLRLNIRQPDSVVQFALISDAGERALFRFEPLAAQDVARLTSSARLAAHRMPASDIVPVASQTVHFKLPYSRLMLENQLATPVAGNLQYRVKGRNQSDEMAFIAASGKLRDPLVARLSMQPATGVEQSIFDLELAALRSRLLSRADQFSALLPDAAGVARTHSELRELVQRTAQAVGEPFADLYALVSYLDSSGEPLLATRLLALATEITDSDWQVGAERQLLGRLAAQERWYQLEGYWAHRLLRYQDARAPLEIAHSLFQQERFETAAKWFWLASDASGDSLAAEALLSALQSNYLVMFDSWLAALPQAEQQAWRCLVEWRDGCEQQLAHLPRDWQGWRSLDLLHGDAAQTLVHNRLLDVYTLLLRSDPGKPLNLNLTGPLRVKITGYGVRNKNQPWAPRSWLNLTLDNQPRRYLLGSLGDAEALAVVTADDEVLSGPVSLVVDIPAGQHSLQLAADQHAALFTLDTQTDRIGQIGAQLQSQQSAVAALSSAALSDLRLLPQCRIEGVAARRITELRAPRRWGLGSEFRQPAPYLTDALPDADALLGVLQKYVQEPQRYPVSRLHERLLQVLALLDRPANDALLAAANAAARGYGENPLVRDLLDDINRSADWQNLDEVAGSDGYSEVASDRWTPLSPQLRLLQSLLVDPVAGGEQWLRNRGTSVVRLSLEQSQNVQLVVRAARSFAQRSEDRRITLEVNGKTSHLNLPAAGSRELSLQLVAGANRIALSTADDGSSMLFYQLRKQGKQLLTEQKNRFYISSANNPLRLFMPPQSWWRLDRQRTDGSLVSEFHYQPEGQMLSLHPAAGESASRYRVLRLHQAGSAAGQILVAEQAVAALYLEPEVDRWAVPPLQSPEIAAENVLAGLEQGTWGYVGSLRQRRNLDEDSENQRERFAELALTYRRQFENLSAWWRSEAAVRQHESDGLTTLATEQYGLWRPSRYWSFDGALQGYYQLAADDNDAEGEWSLRGSLGATWRQYWQNDLENRLRLGGFAHHVSLDHRVDSVDDDVFSPYKYFHQRGLTISDELIYKPWLDTQLRVKYSATSNESQSFSELDRQVASVALAQYYRPFVMRAELFHRRFMADENRARDFDSSALRLDLQWDGWRYNRDLWQARATLEHDFDRASTSLMLQFGWNLTQGQGLDDFAPTEMNFGALREQHRLGDGWSDELGGEELSE